ncbi:uncharacterized protein LOC8287659 [Ricinus communis]|uniref:uncharacterized protein LOC8287659 n=1 Tax=Ricinus communis TaxID=3988 RepID=UPI00201A916A|nr:uncharacterized protein LOC8287659 [Ricinus communis]
MVVKNFRSLSLIHPWILLEIVTANREMVWRDLELRGTILISLLSQVVLIMLGNRRKYIAGKLIKIILWVAYLSADWAATVSLSAISNSFAYSKVDRSYVIMAFWAPFLLLHLGGPDTITALSLEDNELWQRHALGLFVQVYLACQIIRKSWISAPLNVLAILVLLVGVIKYGERTWILWSLSSDKFRDSMLHDPDPGPNYAKFMDEYSSKQAEGYDVSVQPLIEATTDVEFVLDVPKNTTVLNATVLNTSYHFFVNVKPLFADLILSFQDRKNSRSFFLTRTWEEAFDVIEYELGFMFDTFYTKAIVIYTYAGSFLRFINLFLTVLIFVGFWVIDKRTESPGDMGITYLLMGGAIVLELYATTTLLFSDWSMLWFSRHKNTFLDLSYQVISWLRPRFQRFHLVPANDKWSDSLAGYNLINFCLLKRPAKCNKTNYRGSCCSFKWWGFILASARKFCIEMWHSDRYTNLEVIQNDLKRLIFEDLRLKSIQASQQAADMIKYCKQLCAERGDRVLREKEYFRTVGWSVEADFDQSILLWHIATDLCYHFDMEKNPYIAESPTCKASKALADYMLHLLVECPFMLPSGIGKIRFQDTCAEAMEFFQERKYFLKGESDHCKKVKLRARTALLKVNTKIEPSEVKGDRSRSVLFDACELAKSLQRLKTEKNWAKEKWEMISHVWVEMLSYAANQCRFNYHALQLRQGGELLTHVCLLMTHLGISEKFQIAESHERVKLVVT